MHSYFVRYLKAQILQMQTKFQESICYGNNFFFALLYCLVAKDIVLATKVYLTFINLKLKNGKLKSSKFVSSGGLSQDFAGSDQNRVTAKNQVRAGSSPIA